MTDSSAQRALQDHVHVPIAARVRLPWVLGAAALGLAACGDAVEAEPWEPDFSDVGGADAGTPPEQDDGEAALPDGGMEPNEEEPQEMPVIPESCLSLAGEYQMDSDHFLLTQEGCAKLTWAEMAGFFDQSSWTHVFHTDGVTRQVEDAETGAIIWERATIDDTAMTVVRRTASDAVETWRVSFEVDPCDLWPEGETYLTRKIADAAGNELACDVWAPF